jgi:hypothetical protein
VSLRVAVIPFIFILVFIFFPSTLVFIFIVFIFVLIRLLPQKKIDGDQQIRKVRIATL